MMTARISLRVAGLALLVLGVRSDYSGGGGYGGGSYESGGNSLGYDSYSGGGGGSYESGGYNFGGGHEQHGHHEEEHHESHPYEFGYSVKDPHHGTDFGQQETSDGHNVKGSYRVALPDGRIQIVTYHADWKTGFHADVKYEGTAHYPEPTHNNHDSGYNYPSQDISSHHDFGGGDHSYGGYSR